MSSSPQSDTLEDLCENTIIQAFMGNAVTAACRPDHWDTDRTYKQPNLFVKCSLTEQLQAGIPYYRIGCEVTLDSKPKRYRFQQCWLQVRLIIESPTLNRDLTNQYITIGSLAEDLHSQPSISGDLRKRTMTFSLRGFDNSYTS